MNQQIGTCNICGGAVTKFYGAGGGGTYPPKATYQNCGAVQDDGYYNYGAICPVVPMKRYEVQVGFGGYGTGQRAYTGGGGYGNGAGGGAITNKAERKFECLSFGELKEIFESMPCKDDLSKNHNWLVFARKLEEA